MKKLSLLSTLLLLSTFTVISFGQTPPILWSQKEQLCCNRMITVNNDLIVAGIRDIRASITKFNADGIPIWNQMFADESYGYSVCTTSDNCFILAGSVYNGSNHDIYLNKIDAEGAIVWSNSFGGDLDDNVFSIVETAEGDFLMTGSINAGFNDIIIVKADASGDSLWTIVCDLGEYEYGLEIIPAHNGGFMVLAYSYLGNPQNCQVVLFRLDNDGNILWESILGEESQNDVAGSISITSDNGYIICGHCNLPGEDYYDVFLLKTDSDGNELWTRYYCREWVDYGNAIVETDDEGFLIGGSHGPSSFGYDPYLIKTDAEGDTLWTRILDTPISDHVRDIAKTSDNGYFVAAHYIFQYSTPQMIVIRLAGDYSPITVSSEVLNPPVLIPAEGGSFTYDLSFEN